MHYFLVLLHHCHTWPSKFLSNTFTWRGGHQHKHQKHRQQVKPIKIMGKGGGGITIECNSNDVWLHCKYSCKNSGSGTEITPNDGASDKTDPTSWCRIFIHRFSTFLSLQELASKQADQMSKTVENLVKALQMCKCKGYSLVIHMTTPLIHPLDSSRRSHFMCQESICIWSILRFPNQWIFLNLLLIWQQ